MFSLTNMLSARRILAAAAGAGGLLIFGVVAFGRTTVAIPWTVDDEIKHLNAIALDDDTLVWSTCDKAHPQEDAIWRGLPHTRAKKVLGGLTCPRVLRSNAGALLYLERGFLVQTARDGADGRTVMQGLEEPFVITGTDIYYLAHKEGIRSVALAGSASYEVLHGEPRTWHADDQYLVWSTRETLYRMALKGGSTIALANAPNPPESIFIQGAHVVWSGCADGWDDMWQEPVCSVWSVPLEGGVPHLLAKGLNRPLVVAGDGDTIYWVEHDKSLTRFEMGSLVPQTAFFGVAGADGEIKRPVLAAGPGKMYWATIEGTHDVHSYAIKRPLFGSD